MVQVIPLLVETGQQGRFDEVVVVDAPERAQVERVVARDGVTADQALARIHAQTSRRERLDAATKVVDNTGSAQHLAAGVDALWKELDRSRSA